MPQSRRYGQLALPVTLADHATFDNYYPGGNAAVVAALRHLDGGAGNAAWVWGGTGVGKSHLLQAICASEPRSAYLPASQLLDLQPSMLDGFERFRRVCVDDVHALLGQREWETALFRLYNAVAESGGIVMVSSRDNPRSVACAVPDLGSRLRSGSIHGLTPLNDDDRVEALKMRADLRGVTLPGETASYLLTHYRRDLVSLCALLDRLDLASLASRRRLTIPFIKDVLREEN